MKAIVVLGAAVWANGPSPTLIRRCEHASHIWAKGLHDFVVVCGGLGLHPPAEATAMARLMINHGVPKNRIVIEDRSTTTLENLRFARIILREKRCANITIVTDRYHGARALMVARALNLRANASAPNSRGRHKPTQAKQFAREAFALPAYAVRLVALRLKGPL